MANAWFDPEPERFARSGDPDTSRDAAGEMSERRIYVLRVAQFLFENDRPDGWTAWEIHATGLDLGACWWHRIGDVRIHEGWAEWAHDEQGAVIRRPGPSGRMQRAQRINDRGRVWGRTLRPTYVR